MLRLGIKEIRMQEVTIKREAKKALDGFPRLPERKGGNGSNT